MAIRDIVTRGFANGTIALVVLRGFQSALALSVIGTVAITADGPSMDHSSDGPSLAQSSAGPSLVITVTE